MDININSFPASNGDCFLIRLGKNLILIDGGYSDTYRKFLKDNILELADKGCQVRLLVATHIDADHISGLIEFLKDNINNEIIPIIEIWHNSYRHISEFNSGLVEYNGNEIDDLVVKNYQRESQKIDGEISAVQGSTLGSLILKGGYNWNTDFKGLAVSLEHGRSIDFDNDFKIKLLSPDKQKLKRLSFFWENELYRRGYLASKGDTNYDDAFEFLMSQEKEKLFYVEKEVSSSKSLDDLANEVFSEDTSITNGSSISFVIEVGKRKLLFLGDSHPSQVAQSLYQHYGSNSYFDFVKVSHHGSNHNTSEELLKLIDSSDFLISTDGKTYNHPNMELIAKIIMMESDYHKRIHFNYPLEIAKRLDVEDLKNQYMYSINYGDGVNKLAIKIE